jgi:hypothetical protein
MSIDMVLAPQNVPGQSVPGQMSRPVDNSTLYLPTQLEKVNELLESVQGDVTFWGTRRIKKDGYTGTLLLDVLAQWVVNASRYAAEQCDALVPEQKIAGANLADRLRQLYEQSDRQIQQASLLTRIFVWIRERISSNPYAPVSCILDGRTSQDFRSYSKEQFLATFKGELDGEASHPCSDGRFGPPLRIVAKREAIQSLILQRR